MSGISNTELSPPEGGELTSPAAPLAGVAGPGPEQAVCQSGAFDRKTVR